jgi:hypothetical protein
MSLHPQSGCRFFNFTVRQVVGDLHSTWLQGIQFWQHGAGSTTYRLLDLNSCRRCELVRVGIGATVLFLAIWTPSSLTGSPRSGNEVASLQEVTANE